MNHNEIAVELCAELFRDSSTHVVVISHADIELSKEAKSEKKRQHKSLDEFRLGIGHAIDVLSFLNDFRQSEIVGLHCCDDVENAETTISRIYQRIQAQNKHDGYNLFHLAGNVGVLEIWIDR